MTKRALLIGSQTGKLSGVHNDVTLMTELLQEWQFEVMTCMAATATRQGILEHYRALIAASMPEDVALVYYSGHGGIVANPNYQLGVDSKRGEPFYQFIVTTDIDSSTEDDFRGILGIELSHLQSQLTAKTKNVTVILDCCHSARMSRDPDLMPRALSRPWHTSIMSHLQVLHTQGLPEQLFEGDSNPDVVRIVASGLHEAAYEYTNCQNQRIGILTETLVDALGHSQHACISWNSLGAYVRKQMSRIVSIQRPEMEGPTERLLFQLATQLHTGVFAATEDRQGIVRIEAGFIVGIHIGDTFGLMPPASSAYVVDRAIALAVVTEVKADHAQATLEYRNSYTDLPLGTNAFPIKRHLPRLPVDISAMPERYQQQFDGILNGSVWVRRAMHESDENSLAKVQIVDQMLHLTNQHGLLLLNPEPVTEESIRKTAHNLALLARAQHLRELETAPEAALRIPYHFEWGLVDQGMSHLLPRHSAQLSVGERYYISITNNSVTETLFISLFEIGLLSRIYHLTQGHPSGVEIRPGHDYTYGKDPQGGLFGVREEWPANLAQDEPRVGFIVAIFSAKPHDLRSLKSEGMISSETLSPLQRSLNELRSRSELEHLLMQAHSGIQRDPNTNDIERMIDQYAVEHISFLLSPFPRSVS